MHSQHAVKGISILVYRAARLVANAGVIDQHVDPSKSGLHCRHGLRDSSVISHVTGQTQMHGTQAVCTGLNGVGAQVQQCHGIAIACQSLRRSPADAIGSASDYRDG
jgi:hypothetical protein